MELRYNINVYFIPSVALSVKSLSIAMSFVSTSLKLNYFHISFILVKSCIHRQIITQDVVSREILNYIYFSSKLVVSFS